MAVFRHTKLAEALRSEDTFTGPRRNAPTRQAAPSPRHRSPGYRDQRVIPSSVMVQRIAIASRVALRPSALVARVVKAVDICFRIEVRFSNEREDLYSFTK